MHILYFHQHFSTPKGSAGTRSYAMARRLIAAGHSVTMICGTYGLGHTGLDGEFKGQQRQGIVDGIEVVEFDLSYSNSDRFLKRSWTFAKYAYASIGLVWSRKCDLVFATTTPLTAGIPEIVARWIKRKPFVFEVRDLWPELPRAMGVITNPVVLAGLSFLEWASYRSANRCIALAPGIADGIAARGVSRNKIATISNGCDLDLFRLELLEPWRPEGVDDDKLLAIFAGAHGLANGLDSVLDAAKVLMQRGSDNIWIVLIGDGKTKKSLQERAQSEGLSNVIFLQPVPKLKLAGLFAGADIGLQCLANVEAFAQGTSPNKFFDYLSAGLPVLNNYPGWIADLVKAHNCGFVVPPDDPTAFALALEQAASDREACKEMGRNAAQLAERGFDRTRLSMEWLEWVTGAAR